MKKRTLRHLAVLLVSAMLLTGAASAAETEQTAEMPCSALEFAAQNGLLFGRDHGDLCPEAPATRAELAAMLVRLFGAQPQELSAPFTDCVRGAWYYHSVAAAIQMGFLSPTSDLTVSPEAEVTREDALKILAKAFCAPDTEGKILRPQAPITRQELAEEICRLTGDIFDQNAPKAEYGNLLLSSDSPIPEGTVIHGDLLLGCKAPGKLNLENVLVEGKLLVFGQTELSGGSISEAKLFSSCTLSSTVGKLSLCRDEINVCLNGQAEETEINARHAVLCGSGNAGNVLNCGVGSAVSCEMQSYREQIDAGLDGMRMLQTHVPLVTRRNNMAEVIVHFSDIDADHLYGVKGAARVCTLNWYLNGALVKSVPDLVLKRGATESAQLEIPFSKEMPQAISAAAVLNYGEERAYLPLRIELDNSGAEAYYEALEIPTSHVEATMRYACTTTDGTALEAGDTVWFMGGSDYIQVPGGRFTFVPAGSFEIIDVDYYDSSVEYSEEVAASFVNEVHDYSSKTGYLIWCSLYSQHVYVFSGTQGQWRLECHGACASGKNYSPTRPGVYRIYSKEPRWDFDGYIVEYPCAFDADVAFHSTTKYPGGEELDPTVGKPISHGCVRLPDDVIGYIYENCPIDTTVVVW